MPENAMPHATEAPDDLQKQAGTELNALREAAAKDEYGRADWLEISRKMRHWWQDKGYAYP